MADDKSLKICGKFKATVNKARKLDHYTIPKVEDLFATLSYSFAGSLDYLTLLIREGWKTYGEVFIRPSQVELQFTVPLPLPHVFFRNRAIFS